MSQQFKQVIVVGGGLAGLSACHTVVQSGGNVLLLDKQPFLGGNSTKATSGINGALTEAQIRLGIKDSWEQFARDTALSASKGKDENPSPLAQVLCRESAPAIEWLIQSFGLDLSLVSQLGGQSVARTHRGTEKFPGMTITYALMQKLEKIQEQTKGKRARIILNAKVTKLLTKGKEVIGVEYEREGKRYKEYGPVVIATGGFGADFSRDGVLANTRPDLLNLSTTNGEHCTGDGLKIAQEIGADAVDLEWVQVHPTGLVDPSDPDSKVKFLAAEALRGVGGLLLNGDGERFVNELGTRDYVSEVMNKNKGPFRLVLNSAASKEIEWHCKHYCGRGLMKKMTGPELAKEIGISTEKLKREFEKYNEVARTKNDPFGKKFFKNAPFDINDTFHVSQVCPLVHYCMGGVKIAPNGQVVDRNGKKIPGLFACGEVTGGVHGKNRLGGSSLTDCVVYGRVAGRNVSKYLVKHLLSQAQKTGQSVQIGRFSPDSSVGFTIKQDPIETKIDIKPLSKTISMNVSWKDVDTGRSDSEELYIEEPKSQSTTPTTQTESTQPSAPKQLKTYTMEEVAKHNKETDCWVVVNGKVIDATNFLKKHPGGAKAIILYAGRDATEEFNMLHDADVIEKYAPETIIGTLAGASQESTTPSQGRSQSRGTTDKGKVEQVYSNSIEDFNKPNNTISLKPLQPTQPSTIQSRNSGGTQGILDEERKKATFDVKKMITLLDGGEENTERKNFIKGPLENRDLSDYYNWSRTKIFAKHVEQFIDIHKKFRNYVPSRNEIAWMSDYATALKGALMNHHGLFVSTLQGMASDEQKGWWLKKAMAFEIVGCYAQTELGHGSNVRGLQTIATYDKQTQEFVLNTPTLQSIKWWPGALGKIATHALVYAQLILDGKEYGVHVFMVQIRDEHHRPLPGIEVGDLGPKMGDDANDTGFLRLENIRIPREHMLARYQYVTPDGRYEKTKYKTNPKLHYATMMYTRGWMISGGAGVLAKAATIATRYSCVRRQGFRDPKPDASYKSPEFPIIDYQVQRHRVLKQVALTYMLKFTASWMLNKFAELEGGKEMNVIVDTSSLPEIAATSAGLKALATLMVNNGIEDLRKSCGGNGYLKASGLATLVADYSWQVTAEGDFILLMLLTARFLLKSLQKARKGEKLSGPVEYLNVIGNPSFHPKSMAPPQPSSVNQFYDLDYLLNLFKYRALIGVINVGTEMQKRIMRGQSQMDAWNSCSLELVNATKVHSLFFILKIVKDKIEEVKEPEIKRVLKQLAALFANTDIVEENWTGLITDRHLRFAKEAIATLLDQIRPNAVTLVDAFDIPDNVLNSAIGCYDGNVYERLYEAAKKSELNRVDPFDGYNEYLRPHLDLELLKNGNKLWKSKM